MLPGLLRTMRPHQWVKNLFVLAPLVFAQHLFEADRAVRALAGFAVFSLCASAVYVLNDLVDVEADRKHPQKRNRPIASGKVTERAARGLFIGLLVLAVAGGGALGWAFLGTALGYLTNNLAYTYALKRIAYVDVLSIAVGFELRVLAGTFAAEVPASVYLVVVMFGLATFLGLGKRLHEISHSQGGETRAALRAYDPRVITALMGVTGLATVATYAAYSVDPHTVSMFGTSNLWITTLFTLFGVVRFVGLVRRKDDAESPTDAMLRDVPFLANLACWGVCVVTLIYLG